MDNQVKSLKQQLTLLALEADMQLDYLSQGEVAGCVDELALEYDSVVRNTDFMFRRGEISKSQCDCVKNSTITLTNSAVRLTPIFGRLKRYILLKHGEKCGKWPRNA